MLANFDIMIYRHIRPKLGVRANFGILTNKTICSNHHVITKHNAGFNDTVCTDRDIFT